MLLVPARRFFLPRFFSLPDLRELDAAKYEEAPPLPAELVAERLEGGRNSHDQVRRGSTSTSYSVYSECYLNPLATMFEVIAT
jgi:hypothetical protein